jgi:uncharacterized protein with NRDE domain
MVVAEPQQVVLMTNRPEVKKQTLQPGYHSLSNGPLDAPWPKAARLCERLREWVTQDTRTLDDLLADLRDAQSCDRNILPSDPQADRRSRIFIEDNKYGTRCSTVIAIDAAGSGIVVERRYGSNASITGETKLSFRWPAHAG